MKEQNNDNKKNNSKPIWAEFVGKEVIIYRGNNNLIGILNKPNFDYHYVSIRPSMSYEADEKHAYVETELPINIPLSQIETDVVIRPLKKGYLEARVKEINRLEDLKSGNLGFAVDQTETNKSD